jgi:hypothetical protein
MGTSWEKLFFSWEKLSPKHFFLNHKTNKINTSRFKTKKILKKSKNNPKNLL